MLVGEKFWNSITMTPEEFKTKYESDSEFWNEYGEFVYNRMVRDLEEEEIKIKPQPKKKPNKTNTYEGKSMHELNKMAQKIALDLMSSNPNTWKDLLKKHSEHKEIMKQAKTLKENKNG